MKDKDREFWFYNLEVTKGYLQRIQRIREDKRECKREAKNK